MRLLKHKSRKSTTINDILSTSFRSKETRNNMLQSSDWRAIRTLKHVHTDGSIPIKVRFKKIVRHFFTLVGFFLFLAWTAMYPMKNKTDSFDRFWEFLGVEE